MNNELWQQILKFDFDGAGDYPFSVRLAKENHWSKNFTQQALLEYRKFMYLAATSGQMVSPSEIVDAVWHQHLIYTESYRELCKILGKDIQHIPSTHNPQEAEKFHKAKEHTTQVYDEAFGTQPKEIWGKHTMLQSLNLVTHNKTIPEILFTLIPLTLLALPAAFFILKPVYIHINNPYFMIGMIIFTVAIFVYLKMVYNPRRLESIITKADKDSFVNNLHPFEVAYLKTGEMGAAVNGCLGELLHEDLAEIDNEGFFSVTENRQVKDPYLQQAINTIGPFSGIKHTRLLEELSVKSLFTNIARSMDDFVNHVRGSKKFFRLFVVNYIVAALPAVLLLTRIFTGYSRGKSVEHVFFFSIMVIGYGYIHLKQLYTGAMRKPITRYYLDKMVSKEEQRDDWQWRYIAQGPALLSAVLLTVAYPNYDANSGTGGSGCGSSCGGGGSCGGGCGGCGGGD